MFSEFNKFGICERRKKWILCENKIKKLTFLYIFPFFFLSFLPKQTSLFPLPIMISQSPEGRRSWLDRVLIGLNSLAPR